MGTLSNKYFNAQAVEDALDKGVAAYDSMGQIELVYNGTDIRFNNEVVNFQQIVDYITTDTRFCYMVYNNRVLLTSDMQLTGGTRYVFFETSTTDSGLSKNAVVKVYSADGTTISSISHSTIANENFSNKVSTIADNDKNSTVHYPSNKAVTEITDEIKEDLSSIINLDSLVLANSNFKHEVGGIEASNGLPNTSVLSYFYTDYIDVSKYKKINVTMEVVTVSTSMALAFYDINKVFISAVRPNIKSEAGTEVREITIPGNAKYIRTSYKAVHWNTFSVSSNYYELLSAINYLYSKSDKGDNEIKLTFEQGTCYANGKDAPSEKRLRTQAIECNPDKLYMFIVPPELRVNVNCQRDDMNSRDNFGQRKTSFSMKGLQDFFRITVGYQNDSNITVDGAKTLLDNVKCYEISTSCQQDVTIGAYNSHHDCDIKCDGIHDQEILQAAFNCVDSINIVLTEGRFNLTKLYTTSHSGQKAALYTDDISNKHKVVSVNSTYQGRTTTADATIFVCNINEISDNDENSIVLVPRMEVEVDTKTNTNTTIRIEGIKVVGDLYRNKITFIDCTCAASTILRNIDIRADGSTTGLIVLPENPHTENVGIRVGHGSNNGVMNAVKQCMVIYCGKGYSVNGEHFVIEDCLAHHCLVGWYYGDVNTKKAYEHPNVMIGCSIEQCERLMVLSHYGETEESVSTPRHTLVCIGLSTENGWTTPGTESTVDTLPILEIVKGAYRGRIELDFIGTTPFEENGCRNMQYVMYNGNGTFSNMF